MSEAIQVGPFRLQSRLGAGAMGEVWRGEHATQGTWVAVKVVTAALAHEERYRHRFRREVEALAALRHPGIVCPLDYGEVDAGAEASSGGRLVAGSPWVAMEYASGGSLEELPLSAWSSVRVVVHQVLDGLAHAHARGVIHRDLKPGNVLLAPGRQGELRALLGDFGISHPLEAQAGQSTRQIEARVAGTPAYMAPEQFEGRWRDYGPWTDLYALGCMVWELCCGRRPFEGAGLLELCRLHLSEPLPPLAPRFAVPAGLEGWLRALTQKQPSSRLRSAADAAWAFRGLEATPRGPSPLAPPGGGARAATVDDASAPTWTLGEAPQVAPLGVAGRAAASWSGAAGSPPPWPSRWSGASEGGEAGLAGVGLGLFGFRGAPFVGRAAERELLWEALRGVHATGAAAAVVIEGEAGMGSSRLASWLAERAVEQGVASVWRAPHVALGASGQGLARMLEAALGCAWLDRGRAYERALELVRGCGVPEAVSRALSAALVELMRPGGEGGEVPAVRFGGGRERFFTLERLIRLASAERPLVIVLDDVQWGAEAVVLAQHLVSRGREGGLPVCLLLTAQREALVDRPAEAAALAELLRAPGAQRVALGPLPVEEQRRFIQELLRLEPALEEEVVARTEGNPLFAAQLVAGWVEQGALVPTPAGFALRRGASRELPAGLAELWGERLGAALARMSRAALVQEALELGAALGDPIDGAEWSAAQASLGCVLSPSELDQLASRGLLRQQGGEGGWSLGHRLLGEALERQAAAGGRRRGQHLACVAMLEGLYGLGSAGVAERRALHLLAAGAEEEAQEPLLSAVRECLRAGRLGRADQLLGLAEASSPAAWRLEVLGLRARLARDRGELEASAEASNQLLRLAVEAQRPDLALSALKERGITAHATGDLERAARCLEQAHQLALQHDGPAEQGAILLEIARVQGERGERAAASATLAEAQARCEAARDELQAGHCRWLAAELLNGAGEQEAARAQSEAALAIFERLGARVAQSYALNMIAEVDRAAERAESARAHYLKALVLAEETGQLHGVHVLRMNLALMDLEEGAATAASAALRSALPFFEQHQMASMVAVARCGLLACAALQGEVAEVDAGFEVLTEFLSARSFVHPDLATSAERAGEALAARGDGERAERAWCLALGQWMGLGNAARVAAVERRLASPG